MLLCAQYILPITSEPFQKGAVLVRDNVIRDIGTAEMLKLRYPDEEVVDFGQAAIMPGLVDLHTHLENSVMRGIVHDVPYTTWVTSMLEKSAKMDVSDWYDSAILGGLEALSSGITCVADITATGAACTATQKLGMRSVIYREVGAMDKRRVDYAMRIAENDIMHWREEVDGDRITIGVAPAAMYACHPSMFSKVSEFARRENVPVAMHVAGNREEYNFIKYGSSPFSVHTMDQKRGFVEIPPWLPTGTPPVRYALNWGAFESDNVLAIHCVHVDDKDVQKLKEYDVAVAVCPRCNAQLGMGVAPINEFMRAGLRLGMGTDSPAATDFHRHAHRDAHRHAGAARGERGRVPGFGHHAGDGHHRRRPRAQAGRQDRLPGNRQAGRHHRGRPVRLASDAHHRSGFGRGQHLQRRRHPHDHGERHRAVREEQVERGRRGCQEHRPHHRNPR